MPTFDSSIEFEVFCQKCGDGLCSNCETGETRGRRMPFIRISPCETCLAAAKEIGDQEGWDRGHEDGLAEANEVQS